MQRSLNELKENVSFNEERVDKLEVKSVELEQALAIVKEYLERRSLYLEAYSRRRQKSVLNVMCITLSTDFWHR